MHAKTVKWHCHQAKHCVHKCVEYQHHLHNTSITFRCPQALVIAQVRAQCHRQNRLLEWSKHNTHTNIRLLSVHIQMQVKEKIREIEAAVGLELTHQGIGRDRLLKPGVAKKQECGPKLDAKKIWLVYMKATRNSCALTTTSMTLHDKNQTVVHQMYRQKLYKQLISQKSRLQYCLCCFASVQALSLCR